MRWRRSEIDLLDRLLAARVHRFARDTSGVFVGGRVEEALVEDRGLVAVAELAVDLTDRVEQLRIRVGRVGDAELGQGSGELAGGVRHPRFRSSRESPSRSR